MRWPRGPCRHSACWAGNQQFCFSLYARCRDIRRAVYDRRLVNVADFVLNAQCEDQAAKIVHFWGQDLVRRLQSHPSFTAVFARIVYTREGTRVRMRAWLALYSTILRQTLRVN